MTNRSSIEHDTLLAVFNSMAKNYKATDYYLRKINKKTNLTDPIEVSQIKVLNHLKLGNYYEVLDPALQGCSGNDGINCWLIIALNSWEGLLELLGKPLVIHEELVPLTEKYKNMTSPNKFEDEMLLDQKVIEELDNELIKL